MSATPAEQARLIACRDHVQGIIHREGKRRAERGSHWLDAELEAVTDGANVWASRHGLRGVTLAEVERIDAVSTGADWGDKVALRVAERIVLSS